MIHAPFESLIYLLSNSLNRHSMSTCLLFEHATRSFRCDLTHIIYMIWWMIFKRLFQSQSIFLATTTVYRPAQASEHELMTMSMTLMIDSGAGPGARLSLMPLPVSHPLKLIRPPTRAISTTILIPTFLI